MSVIGVFAIFLVLVGLFNLFAPRAAWFVSIGWKISNAEPSDAYLVMHRIGGGIACIVAVVLLFTGIGHTGSLQIANKPYEQILSLVQLSP
ncbi:DUF6199 family natural product biosynthesis protein [Paenibacillus sp. GP183]|uniref:DUF6199 family natural product biosynthesis protein n=1 Tax=Paenibacillus sp. GP183 TaxID=1882751 RepID=UPI00344E492A